MLFVLRLDFSKETYDLYQVNCALRRRKAKKLLDTGNELELIQRDSKYFHSPPMRQGAYGEEKINGMLTQFPSWWVEFSLTLSCGYFPSFRMNN